MANYQFLKTASDLEHIANKLTPWMKDYPVSRHCTIAESFEVFIISAADLQNEEKTARACLGSGSDYWHLQVRVDDEPACCMRLCHTEKDGWVVGARYDYTMAEQIDTALTWIDRYIHDKYTVRMFEIPSFYITGLTLENGDDISVYIVLKAPGIPVDTNRIYSFQELRTILTATQPVRGVALQE